MASDGYDYADFRRFSEMEEGFLYLKVHALRLYALSLSVLLRFGGNREIISVLKPLMTAVQKVLEDLQELGVLSDWNDKKKPMRMDIRFSSILEGLELLNPDIQQVYDMISKSSTFIPAMSHEAVMKNPNNLLKNIKDFLSCKPKLVAGLKKHYEYAQTKLRLLRNFPCFTSKGYNELEELKDLVHGAEFLLRNIACLFSDCSFVYYLSEDEMQVSTVVDECNLGFLDSLWSHILGLSDTKLSFITSDLILSLQTELRILIISFAMYKPSALDLDLFLGDGAGLFDFCVLSSGFLGDISIAIIDIGCLMHSLHNNAQNTDEAKELEIAVSNLKDIIEIAKISYSIHSDDHKYFLETMQLKTIFRISNAQGTIDSSMWISMKIRTPCPSRHRYIHGYLVEVLEKEMQSLIEAFSNLTAKQHLEHRELEIQMSRLKNIRNKTESLISSVSEISCPLWNHNLWLFILIEEIKMLKREFKCLQNQMMHGTSTSKPQSKINAQGKKTMTDYVEVFEDEQERSGEQPINESKKPHSLPANVGMRGIEDGNSNLDLICPQSDEVKALRLKSNFLKAFLSCKGMWHIEDGNLRVLLTHIHSVFQSVDQDLRLWSGLNIQTSPKEVCCLPVNMDYLLCRVLSRLQLLDTDIQGAYAILSKSSIFITGISDEALVENLNTLLENIDVLLKSNTKLVAHLKEELEAVQKSLRFLRNFLGFTLRRCSKPGKLKDLLIHSEFLAGKLSCLLYCCNSEKMTDHMVNEMKMHILYELHRFSPTQPDVREIYIKSLYTSKSAKGNSNYVVLDESVWGFLDSLQDDILKLSANNLNFIASDKEQILSLQGELKFLITFFTVDRSLEEYSQHYLTPTSQFEHINDVIIDLGCVIYKLNDDENSEMMTRELNKKVLDLVANVMVAKADIRKIYDLYVPKPLRSNFPRTNGHGFICSFFRNLNELLNTKLDIVAPLKYHIEIVQNELLSLKEDFGEAVEQSNQCDELQSQWTRFLDIAYQIEFIIDSFLVGGDSSYRHKLGLFNVLEEIKAIKTEHKTIQNKKTDDTLVKKPSQIAIEANFPGSNTVLSSKERPADKKSTSNLVIFGEEADKIRDQLTSEGSKNLVIISIVGMPGIGKTTLADSVFQHSSIAYHFHVRARYSVSQVLDKRTLMLEILQQFLAESERGGDDDNGDLEWRLYQSLKGRRYLILLDDIWNIQHWEDIKACFPNDHNGSRIIFTSRLEDIASQTGLESTKYHLSPLSEETCWKMLKKKLFGDKKCHQKELKMVGREIAANCNGLPLAVDLIAGVLQVKEIENWKKVAKSLVTFLLEDPQGQCRKVLELSYQNLPDDLKPCFLYFAAFPEDAHVPTRDLILLWIAEGFVQLGKDELKSLEDVAKDILKNLINRSLVTVSRREWLGEVDASQVHDLLYEFAVAKAQEERFMLKIDDKALYSTLSPVGVQDQWREQYRLCICPSYWSQIPKPNPSGPRTRALIGSNISWADFSLNYSTFKLLRVLYIHEGRCLCCPEMFTLIHLRLLVIYSIEITSARDIISNIHKLWNLETIIMNGGYATKETNLLVDKICNMVRLRHLCFEGYINFRYLREEIWEKASFANLRTLYNLKASYEEDIEKILKLMPNLVELKALFYNLDGGYYPFPKLDFLNKLESLEVKHEDNYHGSSYPCKIISFPPYLKRLVLSNFGVSWTEISEIENLEYLEALELKNRAFRGPIWEMVASQFPKLKCLSLNDLDIEEWYISEDNLSCLEQLHVEKCKNLKELPSCLANIAALQAIKIFYCTEDVEDSAERIKEEQEQVGNVQFLLDITNAPTRW